MAGEEEPTASSGLFSETHGVSGRVPASWEFLDGGPSHGAWRTRERDLVVIDHVSAPALVGPFLLDDYRHDLRLTAGAHRGGLVECELHDRLGVLGITKEPQPGRAGVTVRGYALAPTPHGHLAVSVLGREGDQPGTREAQVLRDSGCIPLDWLGDPYGYEYDSTQDLSEGAAVSAIPHPDDPWGDDMFVRNRSDSRRFDGAFPQHPLTRVRRHLDELGRLLSLTATASVERNLASACGLRFGIPLGYLQVTEAAWGALFRRVSFAGRVQFLTLTQRPADCARDPQAVAAELARAERAGRITVLRAPRCERRRLGDFDGLYAEHETRVGARELYTAAFVLPLPGGGAVELACSGARDDWVRANRDLNVIARSATLAGDPPAAELSDVSLERIYRVLVRLAYCDGSVDPSERDVLDAFRVRFDLDPDVGDALEQASCQSDRHVLGRDPEEQGVLLGAMIELAAADGVLDPAELRRLRKVARAMGLPDDELLRRIQRRLA